jgi:hypothetical protein
MSEIQNGNGRRGLSVDPRISLGSILSITTLILAIAGFALKYENRITTVENTAAELERRQEKLTADQEAQRNTNLNLALQLDITRGPAAQFGQVCQ